MIRLPRTGGRQGNGLSKVTMKHVQHPAFTSAMATGIALAGPSPDGYVHIQYWREGLRMLQENFEQEIFVQDGIQVARLKADGNETEAFREDVATVLIPVAKFDEFCDAMCKMRDSLKQSLAAREAAMAQHGTEP